MPAGTNDNQQIHNHTHPKSAQHLNTTGLNKRFVNNAVLAGILHISFVHRTIYHTSKQVHVYYIYHKMFTNLKV